MGEMGETRNTNKVLARKPPGKRQIEKPKGDGMVTLSSMYRRQIQIIRIGGG
jgi:hypothetical protein